MSAAPAAAGQRSLRDPGLVYVLLAVLAYSSLHVGFRILASSTLGEDDVFENTNVQELLLGYNPRQPPLYDWVLWAVQRVTGPTLESFLLIKYAALTATAGFLYLSAVRILGSRVWGFLAVESMALIYQISWRIHEGFTHEMGAMVAVAATFWCYLHVVDRGRLRDFVLFGVLVGLGFLTEPAFYVFLMMLLTATALQPALRRRIFERRLIVTFGTALVVAAPFYLWVLSDSAHLAYFFRAPSNYWREMLLGIRDAVRGPFFYLSPLIVFLPFIFPGAFRLALSDMVRPPNSSDTPDLEQLVLHTALAGVALSFIGAVLFAINRYPIQVLMPLYLVSVIWLLGVCKRAAGTERNIGRFTTLALTIAVVALVARLANMFVLDPVCKICRWGIPYPQLAAEIRRAGFENGAVVAIEYDLAGNLRAQMPEAFLVMRLRPSIAPEDAKPRSGKVAFVWGNDIAPSEVEERLSPYLPAGASAKDARLVRIPWAHLWKQTGYRTSDWRILVVDFDRANVPKSRP